MKSQTIRNVAGAGIFPGNKTPYHGLSAMPAFLSGGFCAVTSLKIVTPAFRYRTIVFGSVALITWFLAVFAPDTIISFIGIGETERMGIYPTMLWLTDFGGYLMSVKS